MEERNVKIKVLYRKNLKMSPGKLAAQTAHAVLGLNPGRHDVVVVLEASDKKFFDALDKLFKSGIDYYVTVDAGYTEIEPNTMTCVAFIDQYYEV